MERIRPAVGGMRAPLRDEYAEESCVEITALAAKRITGKWCVERACTRKGGTACSPAGNLRGEVW